MKSSFRSYGKADLSSTGSRIESRIQTPTENLASWPIAVDDAREGLATIRYSPPVNPAVNAIVLVRTSSVALTHGMSLHEYCWVT